MKKLVITTLGAVFALSLVSGITSAKGQPDPSTHENGIFSDYPDGQAICIFNLCDYDRELVGLECLHPNGKTTLFVWSDDDELWNIWCEFNQYQ